ncbi:MAG: hypothetical protein G01um101416_893 [Microgenomates group bacterium Gr01-1014_16]|nr:MAG: hypothetical protein G01um101416_893 [Microgenomates group bacterium Gr01-1014_16]
MRELEQYVELSQAQIYSCKKAIAQGKLNAVGFKPEALFQLAGSVLGEGDDEYFREENDALERKMANVKDAKGRGAGYKAAEALAAKLTARLEEEYL